MSDGRKGRAASEQAHGAGSFHPIWRAGGHLASRPGTCELNQPRDRDLPARQFRDYSATIENKRAMADLSDFFEVARQDHNATPGRQGVAHQQINIRFRSDVDALGRLLQHEHGTAGSEAASQHRLLLVTTAQRGNYPVGISWPNIESFEQVNGATSFGPRIKEAEETPSHSRRVQEEVFPNR